MRRLSYLFLIACVISGAAYAGFIHQDSMHVLARQVIARYAPCSDPISYRIGSIDPEFGLTKKQVADLLGRAERIWEKPTGRDLFSYDQEDGAVTIDFVYDYRQETTLKLKDLAAQLANTRDLYDAARERYRELQTRIAGEKAAYQLAVDAEVPSADLERVRSRVNADVSSLNALGEQLNDAADELDAVASEYQRVVSGAPETFEEGVYESSAGKQTISIYEYAGTTELVRLLAHELGHALGLSHTSDADSLMYPVNISANTSLTGEDLRELRLVCDVSNT